MSLFYILFDAEYTLTNYVSAARHCCCMSLDIVWLLFGGRRTTLDLGILQNVSHLPTILLQGRLSHLSPRTDGLA
jgi:hypothetical protein